LHRRAPAVDIPGMADIALSGVIGSLSYALDVTEGQPPGHSLRSCLIGMRLAEEIGLDARTRSDLFYALLLKDAGCSANASRMAALFGADDGEAKRTSKRVNWSRPLSALVWSGRTVGWSTERLRAIRAEGEVTRSLMQARCDRGAEIARMLFLSEETAEAIRALDEHWDGRGQPAGLAGEEIPLLGRILCLAQTVEIFHADGGVRAAWAVARRRRGRWFDPDLVDAFGAIRRDRDFWAALATPDVSAWEPPERVLAVDEPRLDRIAEAFARVIDAKSPYTARHSERVAELVVGTAAVLGFGAIGLRDLRRAALLARHRQARDLQPHPRQAGQADRGGVRQGPRAPALLAAHPRARALLRVDRLDRRRAPRAPRRERLPVRPGRRQADDPDARARGRRRLRG
jgi:hypothetical protein